MPVKNRIKEYLGGAVYHIYNRGVDGRDVFTDSSDYEMFVRIMKSYLSKGEAETDSRFKAEKPYMRHHKKDMNLATEVELWAYCLMPNHIHLLVRQINPDGITKLMRRVMTNYVMHFNQKRERSGFLWEGVYRGVKVGETRKALVLTKWIHNNPGGRVVRRYGPVETVTGQSSEQYLYSSYQNYTGVRKEDWVNTQTILKEFEKVKSKTWKDYREFVDDFRSGGEDEIAGLTLDRG